MPSRGSLQKEEKNCRSDQFQKDRKVGARRATGGAVAGPRRWTAHLHPHRAVSSHETHKLTRPKIVAAGRRRQASPALCRVSCDRRRAERRSRDTPTTISATSKRKMADDKPPELDEASSAKRRRYDRQLLCGASTLEAMEDASICLLNGSATGTETLKNSEASRHRLTSLLSTALPPR